MAIRVAVAGLGARGQDWVKEIRADAGYQLVACVDDDAEALRRNGNELNVPETQRFTSLTNALDNSACDAVIVATPGDLHTEACEAALDRGLGVLVEKPFTLSLTEAVRLVRLAERKRAPLLVGQNYRYMRAFRTVRRLLTEGALGQVWMVTCQYFRVPHQMAASHARLTNSVLWGPGVHHMDALRYLLGQKVTGVLMESFTLPHGELPPGASIQTILTFEGGTRALYSATYESSGHEYFEGGQEFYARFTGDLATLHVFHRWLFLCARGRWPRPVKRGARRVTEERILLDQLERALLHGEEPEASGRDNLQTMAVMEACVRSAEERRWINPQELLSDAE
ncbi:MAG TPA: Gfo/Idh/MocA family oxidoreductase [Pyrinomonadaceae bacterium]|nr:Gfo/Idh/MocA family oxidoreductase [Pyrinomonadaceae bacterium]